MPSGSITFTGLLIACLSAAALNAAPTISNRSSGKKYALWEDYADKQPYLGDTKIIDLKSHQPVLTLETQVEPCTRKLLWSKDSNRVAYFSDSGAGGSTRVFFRKASSFDEVKLPDLPSPGRPTFPAGTAQNDETRTRTEPLRWLDSGELIVERELQNKEWGRAALEITLAFDPQNRATVVKSAVEPPSVVDYFLLLPAEYFEGPPSIWLRATRDSGGTIDKKNGYMRCAGDGAQPSFEVALFRYRDGRPLLALCEGELEGADSLYLHFFELAGNGKLKVVDHWLFPTPDGGYDPESGGVKTDWEFILPHGGKSVLIRTAKSHRVLQKLTWNGERFEKKK